VVKALYDAPRRSTGLPIDLCLVKAVDKRTGFRLSASEIVQNGLQVCMHLKYCLVRLCRHIRLLRNFVTSIESVDYRLGRDGASSHSHVNTHTPVGNFRKMAYKKGLRDFHRGYFLTPAQHILSFY
jgi:hypothetical protein